MFRVTTLMAKAGIRDQTEMENLIAHLRDKGLLPVIRSMFTGMFGLAKLPEPSEELIAKVITQPLHLLHPIYRREFEILGDLFFTDDLIYALIPIEADMLQASVVGYGGDDEALQRFCADIEEGIKTRFDGRRIRGMEFNWKEPTKSAIPRYSRHRYSPFEDFSDEEPQHGEIELNATKPSYSSEDAKTAKLLVNADIRQFSLKLAQVIKMTSKDTAELIKSDVIQCLLSLGLMAEEYLLTCKQDHHTICVVPSKDHLSKESTASFHCSLCGRAFAEENLQVIYTLTEKGKKLVDGSLWMPIWITELLKENGVREEGIKWRLEANGEELDIMVEDFDSRTFFELKDREFGLGDAYPFVYRVTRYGGRSGIVATMDKVSTDARKFFEEETQRREYPIQIQYLEGSKNIQRGITKLIEDMSLSQARRLTRPFSVSTGFDLWPIVEYWISAKMGGISEGITATATDNNA